MRELRNTKIIAVDHGYGNICATAKGYEWTQAPCTHSPDCPASKRRRYMAAQNRKRIPLHKQRRRKRIYCF